MEEYTINIANDFSPVLGGRFIRLGVFSGEAFYNDLLNPKFLEAKKAGAKLHIYLDGAKGFGSSFLDQSFGELSRVHGLENVENTIVFHTATFEWEVNYIKNNIWQKK